MYTLYAYEVCLLYFYLQEGLNGNFLVDSEVVYRNKCVLCYWGCYKRVYIYVDASMKGDRSVNYSLFAVFKVMISCFLLASDNSQRFRETCFAFALTPQQVQQISSSM